MTTEDEIRGIVGVLRSIADMAENASLTGSMRGGAKVSVRYYNTILKRLQALELVPQELFAPMDEEANMDEVGVASACVAAYLKGMRPDSSGREGGSVGEAFRKMDETMRNLFGKHGGSPEESAAPKG
jgi:hypothetical protein